MDGASDDDIIRERAFRISDKLDLGDLVDDSQFVRKKAKIVTMLLERFLIRLSESKFRGA